MAPKYCIFYLLLLAHIIFVSSEHDIGNVGGSSPDVTLTPALLTSIDDGIHRAIQEYDIRLKHMYIKKNGGYRKNDK